MVQSMQCLVFDCYPRFGSRCFEECACASVVCWIRTDACHAEGGPEIEARARLWAGGWGVVRTLSHDTVSEQTYASGNEEGRERFEQALIDGFVAQIHSVERESVVVAEPHAGLLAQALAATASTISRSGGVTLLSPSDGNLANGLTRNGAEYLPLWSSEEEAVNWAKRWPSFQPEHLSPYDLSSYYLDQLNLEDMLVALGVDGFLTTCHPGWIKALILRQDTCEVLCTMQ